ncbi:MAG TPA: hypothetical protein VJP07_08530 [Dehalococcoidia bacterium]|nr:hypothetical protein [Dehalococcoidia bacterium]
MTAADGMDAASVRTRVIVAGSGDDAPAWARAIRACEDVDVRTLAGVSSEDVLNELADRELDAVVFASPSRAFLARDLAPMVKRAVVARKHVLVATGIADSHQLLLLDGLTRRRERTLLFDACGLADSTLAFVRRMTRRDHPMRRPRHLRVLRSAPGHESIEDLALEALSRVLLLSGELPARVSAYAPRFEDESGGPTLAGLTLTFPSGMSARIEVSSLDPEPRDELTVISDSRTITLDALNDAAPLRTLSLVRRREPGRSHEHLGARLERMAGPERPRRERVASAFIESVRAGQPVSNARQFASAALTWEIARSSMERGGELLSLPAHHPLVATPRPNLQLIEGGGNTIEASEAPRLRVVQGGRRPMPVAPPPRSA